MRDWLDVAPAQPARLNRALAAVADELRAQEGPLVPWAFPSGAEVDRPLRRLPVFLVVVALAVGLWAYLVEPRPVRPGHALASGLAALALVAVQALAYSRPGGTRRTRVALAAALAGVAIVQVALQRWYGPGLLGILLTMVWSARVGIPGLPVAALAIAGYLTVVVLSSNDPANPWGLPYAAAVLVALYAGPMLGRRDRRRRIDQAAAEERARLAREVHDVLAHTLTALAVQLEAAAMVMEERPGDPRAREAVVRAQRLATAGLEEIGQAVAALRGDRPPGPESVPRLVEEFERRTGVPSRFRREGEPVPLPPDAALALYRAAQEALTNVGKHADAEEVDVRLRYADQGVELTVVDRGRPGPTLPSSGYGLIGIRERAALLGGRLEARPTADGFLVRLWVPRCHA
jgi:signal transduction histidine kinase